MEGSLVFGGMETLQTRRSEDARPPSTVSIDLSSRLKFPFFFFFFRKILVAKVVLLRREREREERLADRNGKVKDGKRSLSFMALLG